MAGSKSRTGLYTVLGCFGALAVALVIGFGSLFYFGFVQRGGVYDGLRVQLAQTQLNQLVPYIEMYRAQHGSSPETLEQVAALIPANTPVMIQDASGAPLAGAPRNYYYERVDNDHYILRSVGADGVAFTDDDILPTGFQNGQSGLLLTRPAATPAQPPASAASDRQ